MPVTTCRVRSGAPRSGFTSPVYFSRLRLVVASRVDFLVLFLGFKFRPSCAWSARLARNRAACSGPGVDYTLGTVSAPASCVSCSPLGFTSSVTPRPSRYANTSFEPARSRGMHCCIRVGAVDLGHCVCSAPLHVSGHCPSVRYPRTSLSRRYIDETLVERRKRSWTGGERSPSKPSRRWGRSQSEPVMGVLGLRGYRGYYVISMSILDTKISTNILVVTTLLSH
ncbi:hypothetical protein GGR52DRAFT_143036 [Hypoxylon sp. FL1284]|nr:hypothetical protein GGR52DRAFT_143036 [Hypoxylon sp. FL1284]